MDRWLPSSAWCKNCAGNSGVQNMSDWKKPEFVEIRMDAEINCYSSAIADDPRVRVLRQPVIRDDRSETSQES